MQIAGIALPRGAWPMISSLVSHEPQLYMLRCCIGPVVRGVSRCARAAEGIAAPKPRLQSRMPLRCVQPRTGIGWWQRRRCNDRGHHTRPRTRPRKLYQCIPRHIGIRRSRHGRRAGVCTCHVRSSRSHMWQPLAHSPPQQSPSGRGTSGRRAEPCAHLRRSAPRPPRARREQPSRSRGQSS